MKFKIKGKLYTEEEARELYNELDKIFGGSRIIPMPYPVYPDPGWPVYPQPIITYGDNTADPLPRFPQTIC